METAETIRHLEEMRAEIDMLASRLNRSQEYAAQLEAENYGLKRDNQRLRDIIRQLQSNAMDEVQ